MAIRILSSENISGEVLIASGKYLSWGTAGATSIEGSTVSNKLQFRTNSTNAVIIDSSQNVGIGNFTNPNDGNLVVKKDGLNTGIPNSLTNASFSEGGGQLKGLTIGYRTDETTAVIAARTATGDIAFMGYDGGWLETARFTNDNKLGIGTNDPDGKVHIFKGSNGATTVGTASDELILENDTDCGLTIRSAADATGVVSFASPTDHNVGQLYYNHDDDSMVIRTNDAIRTIIGSSGIMYIMGATASTNNSLQLQYNSTAGTAEIYSKSTGGNTTFEFYTSSSGTTTQKFNIGSSGDVKITTNGKFLQGVRNTSGTVIDMIGFGAGTDRLQIKGGASGGAESIAFFDTAGQMATFYDSRFGIGNTTPKFALNTNLAMEGASLAYLDGTSNNQTTTNNIGVTHNASGFGGTNGAQGGLFLANNNNANNAPSPIIFFGARSASSTYNHAYAAIYGIKTGGGADSNWNVGELTFATGDGTGPRRRMTINKDGNVGIGTTSPGRKLTVTGDVSGDANNLLLVNENDTDGDSASIGFSMLSNNTYVKAGIFFKRTTTQGRGELILAVNNEVNGNNVTLSDSRLTINNLGDAYFYREIFAAATTGTRMRVPRNLFVTYGGSSYDYTFDPVALFGSNQSGGTLGLRVSGWPTRLFDGIIIWRNDGGGSSKIGTGVVTLVTVATNDFSGVGVSVSLPSANTNEIKISFSGFHSNDHGWECYIKTEY